MCTRLNLFAAAELVLTGKHIRLDQDKTSAILIFLAYESRWVSRYELCYLLWPDKSEKKARANIRQVLLRANKRIAPLKIERTKDELRFCIQTDVAEFKTNLKDGRWQDAHKSYTGPLLKEFYQYSNPEFMSWLEFERMNLYRQYYEASRQLIYDLHQLQNYNEASKIAAELYQNDAYDESLLRDYLCSEYWAGRRERALTLFSEFKQTILQEFGNAPSHDTLVLAHQIETNQNLSRLAASVSIDSKPAKRDDKLVDSDVQTNLPFQLSLPKQGSQYISRPAEEQAAIRLLKQENCQVLTLLGWGGSGKTRLAIELASQLESEFDELYFVSLTSVMPDDDIIPAVLRELNVTNAHDSPVQQLISKLKSKKALLVLDNMEHLKHAREAVKTITENLPRTKLLLTSRTRLSLRLEWVLDIKGMEVASSHLIPSEELINIASIQLFLYTAERIVPLFDLRPELEKIAAICNFLEGLPLAIELTASWLRFYTVSEILEKLHSGSFDVLQAGFNDMPKRQESIEKVFETSWQLLTDSEQKTLESLTVFHGGFREKAALIVSSAKPLQLLSLIDKGFVNKKEDGRYYHHKLIEQYLKQKVEQDKPYWTQAKNQHCFYFADHLKRSEPKLASEHEVDVFLYFDQEFSNLKTAWNHAIEQAYQRAMEQCIPSLMRYLYVRSRFQEAIDLLTKARQSPRFIEFSEPLKAQLLSSEGHFLYRLGRKDQAAQRLEQVLKLNAAAKDKALAHNLLAALDMEQGHLEKAAQGYKYALHIYKEQQDRHGQANCLSNLSLVSKRKGAFKDAEDWQLKSLALRRELGDGHSVAISLAALGTIAFSQKSFCQAQGYHLEAYGLRKEMHNPKQTVDLNMLGACAYHMGDYDEAERYWEESLKTSHIFQTDTTIVKMNLGILTATRSDFESSKPYFHESLDKALKQKNLTIIAQLLVWTAVFRASEEPQKAALQLQLCLAQTSTGYFTQQIAREKLEYLPQTMIEATKRGAQSIDFLVYAERFLLTLSGTV